jgi:cellulose synthase/poly-beta-1,6-N-acetylglucosamine synthase-like glycosyltransferase
MLLNVVTFVVLGPMVVFLAFYLFYFVLCLLSLRILKPVTIDKSVLLSSHDLPKVSMIVPVYNEARVVTKKVEDIGKTRYPASRMEAVFVDGGSTDGTADLIEKECKSMGASVRVIRQGYRKGFNAALIEGFPETTGDVICIPGAETEYHPDALRALAVHLMNQRIGAVTGRQEIRNWAEGLAPALEVSYRGLYDFIRAAESRIDSPFDLKGEISACRRNIFADLVARKSFWSKGCLDACFGFQARVAGYRTVYEPSAVYYERAASKVRDSLKQRVRRAATLIQNMMIFKDMMLNKRFGLFGMIIMPAHFLMLVVLPFFFALGAAGLLGLMILSPDRVVLVILTTIVVLAILLSPEVQAFCITQVVLVIAVLRLLTGIETQKFERLGSARD